MTSEAEPARRDQTTGASGMPEAQLALGQMFLERGEYETAFGYFAAAARGGDPRGFNMLGRAFERGWGTQQNSREAAAYYRKAAEMGDIWAKFNLADLLCRGDGIERDEASAFGLYAEAANRGHLKSLNMLALFYEDGRVVGKSLEKAREFYEAGAEGGDCWAGFNLARLEIEAGRDEEALTAIRNALTTGFADFYRHVVAYFGHSGDPRFAAVVEHAAALASRTHR